VVHSYDYQVEEDEGGELQRGPRTIYYEFVEDEYEKELHAPRHHDDLKAVLRCLVLQAAWLAVNVDAQSRYRDPITDLTIAVGRFADLHARLDEFDFVGMPEVPLVALAQYKDMVDVLNASNYFTNGVRSFVNSTLATRVSADTPPLARLTFMIDASCAFAISILYARCADGQFPVQHFARLDPPYHSRERAEPFSSSDLKILEEEFQERMYVRSLLAPNASALDYDSDETVMDTDGSARRERAVSRRGVQPAA